MSYSAGTVVSMAAATFGLITAVIVGGPVGRLLIVKYNLKPDNDSNFNTEVASVNASTGEQLSSLGIVKNVTAILVCMAVGIVISGWVGKLIGMSFPTYVGAMFVVVVLRNINERKGKVLSL